MRQLFIDFSGILFISLLSFNNSFSNECMLNKGIGFGFQVSQNQNDFGLGLNFNFPYFFDNTAAIRLRGNFMFYEHAYEGKTVWTDYRNISLGVFGVLGKVGDNIRLSGELGGIVLFPSELFSTNRRHIGWYGLFGFEFYINNAINYFIEIGGMDTGAKADLLPLSPIHSNGFLINAGIRISLKQMAIN